MGLDNLLSELAIIFGGAALLGSLFLYLKQPIILAYMAWGICIGPTGFKVISSAEHIEHLSHIGIVLLLFLLGLNLHPEKLLHLFRRTSIVTLTTSLAFFLLGAIICLLFGYAIQESMIVGAALMFSSTIVSLKLTPTITLHQKHTGEMMVSVLLFQDILAILLLLLLSENESGWLSFAWVALKLAGLGLFSFIMVRFVIMPLFHRFDRIKEYFFLVSLGWCLFMAELAHKLGLSYEMGAFIAGVALAAFPIALIISENLKPIREFFLILFFFCIGARLNISGNLNTLLPCLALAGMIILSKPLLFHWAFRRIHEEPKISKELGIRLGQASEFSLLVSYSALEYQKIAAGTASMIQIAVLISFIASTYWVVFKFQTPISPKRSLQRD